MTEEKRIRVLVVDDHTVVRSGIKFSLLAFDDIDLVGEASNGQEALRLCTEARPDVVLMDMMMPGMDGVATTRAIRERCPEIQVIALTSFQEGALVQDALQAGAISYLLKDVAMDELVKAIRLAHAGQSTLAPAATQALMRAAEHPPQVNYDLTERQLEVLALIAEGLSNEDIAAQLTIAVSTVRFHVSAILSKLGASNRTEAAALGVKHGLIS